MNTKQQHFVYLFGLFTFLAFLLRPEAILLVISFGIITIVAGWNRDMRIKFILVPLSAITVSFFLPLLIYLVWKYLYFGTIIPNPFFIKAAISGIFSSKGVTSVLTFISSYSLLIITGLFSFVVTKDNHWERVLAGLFCLLYTIFFVRVDTLMDVYGRFMYPISIFLVFLSIPTCILAFQYLFSIRWHNLLKVLFIFIFLLALTPVAIYETLSNFQDIICGYDKGYVLSNSLMQKEYRVAIALSQYRNIRKMKIAFGDAGVIPYFTETLHLDIVGLNDRFIARERDLSKLTEYFFNQLPDLVMLGGNKNYSWIEYGHGHLGNFTQWSFDKRWDRYSYVGTIKTEGDIYDIHLFLRRNLPEFEQFKSFLQKYVVDGYFSVFPISIGSYNPSKSIQYQWITLSSGMK